MKKNSSDPGPFARLGPGKEQRRLHREMALASLEAITPEEDAAITQAAMDDPDARPFDDADYVGSKPFAVHLAEQQAKRLRGQRGPQKAPTRTAISLRLEPDVLAFYRATGKGWQGRINDDLRQMMKKA